MAKVGRPTNYKPELCKDIIDYFNIDSIIYKDLEVTKADGSVIQKTEKEAILYPTIQDWRRKHNISNTSFNEWVQKFSEFADAVKEAKESQERILVQAGLQGLYNPTFAGLFAQNYFKWRNKNDNTNDNTNTNLNVELSPKQLKEELRKARLEKNGSKL